MSTAPARLPVFVAEAYYRKPEDDNSCPTQHPHSPPICGGSNDPHVCRLPRPRRVYASPAELAAGRIPHRDFSRSPRAMDTVGAVTLTDQCSAARTGLLADGQQMIQDIGTVPLDPWTTLAE